MERPRRALIFDLDGTLVDTVYAHVFAWQRALAEVGLPIDGWRIHRRVGMSGGLFARAAAREIGRPLSDQETEAIQQRHGQLYREVLPERRPLPGAVVFQKCSLRFLVAADLSVHRALAERPRPFPAWVPKNAEALGEGSFLTTTASACGSGGTTGSSGSRLRRYRFYGTPHSFDGAVLAFGRLAFSFEQAGLYVTALNGKMYLFGGFDLPASGPPGWNPVNDAWQYDPTTDAWRALAPMPTTRGGGVAAVVGGKCYVIGGAGPVPDASAPVIRPRQPQ